MKKCILNLLIIASSGLSLLTGCDSSKPPVKPDNGEGTETSLTPREWLREHAIEINDLESSNTDYSDLEELKTILQDKRIVMLGEQTHGDGTTFKAKVRLIQFLHQEMGFDVLTFESGFYDCAKSWARVEAGESVPATASDGIFPIWASCEEVRPLFDYMDRVRVQGAPLELAGFDCQFTGMNSREYFLEDLENFLSSLSVYTVHPDTWARATPIIDKLFYYDRMPSAAEQQFCLNVVDSLITAVESNGTLPGKPLESTAWWLQMLQSLRKQAQRVYGIDSDVNARDIQMAQNLLWMADHQYAGCKIIVWAATYHIIHNIQLIDAMRDNLDYKNYITMGHRVWEDRTQDIYVLGFTGYEGSNTNILNLSEVTVAPATAGSFDHMMKETCYQNAWVDFSSLPEGGEWLKEQLISRPLGNAEMKADWTQIVDGMFFTAFMRPSTRN